MLIPIETLALLLSGTICLVHLPRIWSIPMKKLYPFGCMWTIHPMLVE